MLKKLNSFIEENNLFQKNTPIVCAVSGGVDSICLLHILHDLGYKVILAHVNHHKRIESEIEQKQMEQLAYHLHIPFEVLSYYDTKEENFQSMAHHARYNFFKSVADKYQTTFIATAHHLDDQAETIIMRMISGSNLYGYAGISLQQEIDGYHLIRPLLCVNKNELYLYAKEKNYPYFEDQSNASNDYLRNRIRHNIIPILKEENPNLLFQMSQFSIITKEAFTFIRKQSIKYLNELNNSIRISTFLALDVAVQKDILCLLFERNKIDKNYQVIMKCLNLIQKQKNTKYILKGPYILMVEYGYAQIIHDNEPKKFCLELDLNHPCKIDEKYLFYFSKKLPQNNAKYIKLCYNSLKLPLKIRNREQGDFIQMSYGNKKIARLMIDAKMSSYKRNQTPIITDADDHVLWVYDIAKSKEVILQKSMGDIYLVCEELNHEK
ncbi:MAG: tRNA lysidine(34) synthetase TilS [Anaeroplasmataceae bacterium]|nr:tRNA lysidine(34) synthetase TilS [Anaeroplasmataceae bacterium]